MKSSQDAEPPYFTESVEYRGEIVSNNPKQFSRKSFVSRAMSRKFYGDDYKEVRTFVLAFW